MGSLCCSEGTDEERNHLVDSDIRSDRSFFKQIKLIHTQQGFTKKDRRDYQAQIENQIIEQMQKLITRGREFIDDDPDQYSHLEIGEDAQESANVIEYLHRDLEINNKIARHISILWDDNGIRNTFELRGKLSVPDSCSHFFENVKKIAKPDYIPSDKDILLVRKRTTGIIEEHFVIKGTKFHIFDVGGQRNERKKWIHCFENVTAVIFVASLSCYDETLLEDDDVIVMHETLTLFEEICNSRWFQSTSFILFLNKRDLFEEKILKKALTDCFPEYNGSTTDFDECYGFIKRQFEAKNKSLTNKHIYTHCTCATDKDNVERVFNDVQHIVIQCALNSSGLL